MRWFNKDSIKRVIQWFILTFTMLSGFFFTYAMVLHLIGVPLTKWLFIGSFMLGISSTYGFIYWMVSENDNYNYSSSGW